MTGGAGFSRDSQKSSQQNRALRQKNGPFERIAKNKFINPPALKFKEATPEELEQLKQDFLKQKKAENQRTALRLAALLAALGLIIWWMVA